MLVPLGPDLWTDEDFVRLPAGVRLPVRMTVVRLPRGGLVVHSPLPLTDDRLKAVARIDAVEYLIAPNTWHHLYAGQWLQRFAGARLFGPRGLARKRKDLPLHGVLDEGAAAPWSAVLEQLHIAGAPALDETVFLHRATGSLVVSDLLFNVTRPANFATKVVLTFTGTRGRLAMSRVWKRITKDRQALKASVERVLAWGFTRILPGHGDIVEGPETPARARAALAWALE